MKKAFTINEAPYSVRCLIYHNGGTTFRRVIIACHGFGGHKGNGASRRLAEYVLSRSKDAAVLCFDWPCHGEDARKKLMLGDCDAYLRMVTDYAGRALGAQELYLYATSFGGYLGLKYIAEHGSPFDRVALRCPAVNMYAVLTENIMTEDNRALLDKGKDALVGFDRKIRITPDFLGELQSGDILGMDYLDSAESMLILHGTGDEIVPVDSVRAFAERNLIELIEIENADHRFVDLNKMTEAIKATAHFFGFS